MAHPRADLQAYTDRGTLYSALAYTGLAVGVLALGAASLLFVLDPRRGDAHGEPPLASAKTRRLTVAPSAWSGGGGVVAGGAW